MGYKIFPYINIVEVKLGHDRPVDLFILVGLSLRPKTSCQLHGGALSDVMGLLAIWHCCFGFSICLYEADGSGGTVGFSYVS